MYRKFQLYGFLKNLRFFDPFIILFFREMGLSFLQIGVLYSIREVSTNALEIPTGVIADSFGRRRAMLFSFSSYLVSFGLFYAFHSFWVYALAMVAFAFGDGFRPSALLAAGRVSVGPRRPASEKGAVSRLRPRWRVILPVSRSRSR